MNTLIAITILILLLFFYKKNRKNKSFTLRIDFIEAYTKQLQYLSSIQAKKKTFVDNDGYVKFKNSRKVVHRWVMKRHLGRKLSNEEVIHHIDGNKKNNNIENLELCPNQEVHNNKHLKNLLLTGDWHGRQMHDYW